MSLLACFRWFIRSWIVRFRKRRWCHLNDQVMRADWQLSTLRLVNFVRPLVCKNLTTIIASLHTKMTLKMGGPPEVLVAHRAYVPRRLWRLHCLGRSRCLWRQRDLLTSLFSLLTGLSGLLTSRLTGLSYPFTGQPTYATQVWLLMQLCALNL